MLNTSVVAQGIIDCSTICNSLSSSDDAFGSCGTLISTLRVAGVNDKMLQMPQIQSDH